MNAEQNADFNDLSSRMVFDPQSVGLPECQSVSMANSGQMNRDDWQDYLDTLIGWESSDYKVDPLTIGDIYHSSVDSMYAGDPLIDESAGMIINGALFNYDLADEPQTGLGIYPAVAPPKFKGRDYRFFMSTRSRATTLYGVTGRERMSFHSIHPVAKSDTVSPGVLGHRSHQPCTYEPIERMTHS